MPSLKSQIADIQTFFPWLPPAKFAATNFLARYLGIGIDHDFKLLEALARGGARFDLALDIGANWGQSIVALERYADPQRIIAFEPYPMLARRLARRYRGRDDRTIEECALGDRDGAFVLHVPAYRNYVLDGLASIDPEDAARYFSPRRIARFDSAKVSTSSFEVSVRRLDDFALRPDVVKLDVQGWETQVVRGGWHTFSSCRPVTIIENPREELIDLLARIGMRPYHFDLRRLHPYRWQYKNATFMTEEQASQARKGLGLE